MEGDGGAQDGWDVRLRVETGHSSGCTVAYIGGDLDYTNAAQLCEQILSAIDNGGEGLRIVLDLGEVEFLDSSGLGAVVRLWKTVRATGGDLGVARPPRICSLMMERTGLAEHITMAATVQGVVTRLLAVPAPDARQRSSQAG